MLRKKGGRRSTGLSSEEGGEIAQKSVLYVPVPAGLYASEGMTGSISRAAPPQVGVLSQGEKRKLRP